MVEKALKGLMGIVVGVASVAVVAPVQAATDPVQLDCTLVGPGGGSGATQFHQVLGTNVFEWSISGVAVCNTPASGQYEAVFTGAGKSTGLGACSSDGVVNNLSILVDITFTRLDTGLSVTDHENWGAPVTTFPETTPYLVTVNGQQIGQGTLFTHIFDHCPPGGTNSTVYEWTQAL